MSIKQTIGTIWHSYRIKIELAILLALSVTAFWSFTVAGEASFDGLLRVYFLDVGQGDSILIQAPNGNQVLIDGGPDDSVLRRLGEVMPLGDRTIDAVVLTHSDADHLNGLLDVLRTYDVANVVETGLGCSKAQCQLWEELVEAEGAQRWYVSAGDKVELAEGIVLDILYPFENIQGKIVKAANNSSIVARLIYEDNSLLLTGDIEAPTEKTLVSHTAIQSQFLKVPHHGSKTSSTDAFLSSVQPAVAFIEVGGRNRYGHPHPLVMGRLDRYGIKHYRTDIYGTIELVLDGREYLVNPRNEIK